MAGHLFITRGDIRRLACDAWLLPTAQDLRVEDVWTRGDVRLQAALREGLHDKAVAAEPAWGNQGVRSVRMLGRDGLLPEVWLGNVGGHSGTDVAWILKAVAEFIQRAEAPLGRDLDPQRRDRPLLAIPFVGTGAGGLASRKGQVAQELVRQLSPVLAKVNADVVLIAANPEALAAAHRARRLAVDDWPAWWRSRFGDDVPLGDPFALGQELAAYARRGRLVLFVGAGVSAGAGLPQWEALLEQLAARAGLSGHDLANLGHLDRATVIESALARHGIQIGDAVAALIPKEGPYSLLHSLIATLPSGEIVTTNYDTRLESAAADADRPLTALQGTTVAGADRWLLKLHGSVERPEDIVLSRDDYLGYGQRRAALRGVVQAMLMTRHMLFVGFGLSDDNFHAIAHDVRTALASGRDEKRPPFGTAVLVKERPLFTELWKGDIDPAALAPAGAPIGVGARRAELLLDLVLAESEGALSHFMDPAFEHLLSPSEQRLRSDLAELWRAHDPESPAWDALGELLARLGYRGGVENSHGL
jgi:hypothetical protein